MAKGMTVQEAKAECERWFAYLKRQQDKASDLAKLAAARRKGEIDERDAERLLRIIQGKPTVFDGANLEKAVRVLLKHIPA